MELREDSYVTLNDGHKMPIIGFGTFAPPKFPKSLAEDGVKLALEVGYRHIDNAFIYRNEVEVGRAIRQKIADGTVKRENVFYTGKPGDYLLPVDENGKLIYRNTDIRDTWKALEECKDAGLARSIGVSNFNKRQIELILNCPELKYKPVCNQAVFLPHHLHHDLLQSPGSPHRKPDRSASSCHGVSFLCILLTAERQRACAVSAIAQQSLLGCERYDASDVVYNALRKEIADNGDLVTGRRIVRFVVECHIYLNQSKLLEFLKSHDIVLVAFGVLGSSRNEKWIEPNSQVLLEDPVLTYIAEKVGRTPAQVAARYLLQRGAVLAKSFTPARIKENFQVFDFQLNAEEMKTLDGLNRNLRYLLIPQWKDHPKYPFHDEY